MIRSLPQSGNGRKGNRMRIRRPDWRCLSCQGQLSVFDCTERAWNAWVFDRWIVIGAEVMFYAMPWTCLILFAWLFCELQALLCRFYRLNWRWLCRPCQETGLATQECAEIKKLSREIIIELRKVHSERKLDVPFPEDGCRLQIRLGESLSTCPAWDSANNMRQASTSIFWMWVQPSKSHNGKIWINPLYGKSSPMVKADGGLLINAYWCLSNT